jgi:hypothetical protein
MDQRRDAASADASAKKIENQTIQIHKHGPHSTPKATIKASQHGGCGGSRVIIS